METVMFTEEQTKLLAEEFGKAHPSVDIQHLFCEAWPAAKQGLDALKQVVGLIPGGNFVLLAINAIEAVGDAASSTICPKTSPAQS